MPKSQKWLFKKCSIDALSKKVVPFSGSNFLGDGRRISKKWKLMHKYKEDKSASILYIYNIYI